MIQPTAHDEWFYAPAADYYFCISRVDGQLWAVGKDHTGAWKDIKPEGSDCAIVRRRPNIFVPSSPPPGCQVHEDLRVSEGL